MNERNYKTKQPGLSRSKSRQRSMQNTNCLTSPAKNLHLVEEIFSYAPKNCDLTHLLEIYKTVLRKHKIDPNKDTKLYHLLIKIHKNSTVLDGLKQEKLVFFEKFC